MSQPENTIWQDDISLSEQLAQTSNLEKFLDGLEGRQLNILNEELLQEQKQKAEGSLFNFFQLAWSQFDPAPFSKNWHIGCMAEHLEALAKREIKDLIINVPPRCGKSLLVSVAFPAWVWAREQEPDTWFGPRTSYICASYAHSLVLTHATICRSLIYSSWYSRLWGSEVKIREDQGQKSEYALVGGGTRLSVSVGSRLTGFGYDILIIDDPHNATEVQSATNLENVKHWADFAMSTRANNPRLSCRVLVMQRLHEDDLTGHKLEEEEDGAVHLCLPMEYESDHPFPTRTPLPFKDPRKRDGEILWKDRFDKVSLERIKRPLGALGVAGQLQQRPTPREGRILDPDKIVLVQELPKKPVKAAVRGWDIAGTDEYVSMDAAYTAAVKLVALEDDPYIYIVDVKRRRASPEKVRALFRQTAVGDGRGVVQDIPQDPGAAGIFVVNDLRKSVMGYPVVSSPEQKEKATRAMPFGAEIDAGMVKAVRGEWWDDYSDELWKFPLGKYMDQVDASSRAFGRLASMISSSGIGSGPRVLEKTLTPEKRELEESRRMYRIGERVKLQEMDEELKEAMEGGKVDAVGL